MTGGMGAMGHAVMWGKWVDARFEKPDADIMVLGYYAPSEVWWLVTWDGEQWLDVDSNVPRRVSHWLHLPEGPGE